MNNWQRNWRPEDDAQGLSQKLSFAWSAGYPRDENVVASGDVYRQLDYRRIKALLYASPDMIRAAEAWVGQQQTIPDQSLIYKHFIELGALRHGPNVWICETRESRQGRYKDSSEWRTLERGKSSAISERWIDNKLDMRETVEAESGRGLREFFRDGEIDPDRPAESYIPMDKLGVKVEPRPEPPHGSGLLRLPRR